MTFTLLFVVAGLIFVVMALSASVLKRLPLTGSLLYLGVGVLIGPVAFDLIRLDPIDGAAILERVSEIVVVVSLFTVGLQLRLDWRDPTWLIPLRLAVVSMAITVALIASVGVVGLGLSLGAAILLGGILAPTDPVLASDVQVSDARDLDRLRFGLTGEAGFNDGTAFPFVMLGLGVLGFHELGPFGLRWVAVDVVWAVAVGLAVGALLGTLLGRLVVHLRRERQAAVGLDDFIALGLIGLAYGVALLLHGYGFLAVFAAGLALGRVERTLTDAEFGQAVERVNQADAGTAATHPELAPTYMTQEVLGFNQRLERIGEVLIVVLVGSLLFAIDLPAEALWFVPLLLLGIRPLAVALGLAGAQVTRTQRRLTAWFGIRGIGSIFYLAYAIEHGLEGDDARLVTGLTLSAVAVSVVVHGVSVTPLMTWYGRREDRRPRVPGEAT